MHSQHAQTSNQSVRQHRPYLDDFPPATSAVIPAFRQLTGVERDTFVAALQLDEDTEPCGRDILECAKGLGQSSSEKTIYRALNLLTDYGYLRRSAPEGVERTYVPTRNGVSAYCRARKTEFQQT